ncbi:hypothetical protein ACFRFU_50305 [Streptomyces sp. NPDC056704]|uniref:hypothetical protein n=1 Tax=Streptomyces sp. NPDC056704 TaxID=3345917 RepID=UPI003679FB43
MAGLLVLLFHDPGQAGQHAPVSQLQQRFGRGVVESAARTSQKVLVADDEGFLVGDQ